MSKKKKQKEFKMSREEYINHLAHKSNEIHITNHNSKTGVCCNNLALPTCTCRDDAPCKATGCYCMKGTQAMATVVAAYLRNLTIYNRDPEDFWEQVEFKIKHNPLPLFRFFDAGDIPSYEFLYGMVELAKKFPNIKFMSFTKRYNFVNDYLKVNGKLPDNLNIIFSAWHIGWEVDNPYGMPVAYVDFADKTLNPEFPKGITGCPNQKDKTITCSVCQKCWNKNVKAVKFVQH